MAAQLFDGHTPCPLPPPRLFSFSIQTSLSSIPEIPPSFEVSNAGKRRRRKKAKTRTTESFRFARRQREMRQKNLLPIKYIPALRPRGKKPKVQQTKAMSPQSSTQTPNP